MAEIPSQRAAGTFEIRDPTGECGGKHSEKKIRGSRSPGRELREHHLTAERTKVFPLVNPLIKS